MKDLLNEIYKIMVEHRALWVREEEPKSAESQELVCQCGCEDTVAKMS
jgi:hypothetical protein